MGTSRAVIATSGDDPSRLEKGATTSDIQSIPSDVIIVSWSSSSDPSNPQNWSQKRKWFTTILVSFGGLVTLMSGAMLAPGLRDIARDLKISENEASLVLSIYMLAFAFGPMLLAPCSEVWGRRPIWIFGSAWYCLWNTVCGFSKTEALIVVGRLMAGFGASAEFAVSGAIVADCWSADERGKSFAIRGFLPLLGPALGPIVGGVTVQKLSWRWTFWVLSIFAGLILVIFLVALPETQAHTLLSRKAASLRKSTGKSYYTQYDLESPSLAERLKLGMLRPTRLLLTQPVIQIVSIILAYQFGILYIALSTFATLWTDRYKQPASISGLHYLSGVTGYIIASQLGAVATDRVWARLKEKHQGETKPEYRVPLIVPGAILMPIGLLWYGWSAQAKLHWIMPDIGYAIFGCGYIASGYAAQAYITDAFLEHNASAAAASQMLRNIFAFAFPIFAPSLYNALGYGYGNTTLAAIAIVLGLPGPYFLWKYGEALRAKGGALR